MVDCEAYDVAILGAGPGGMAAAAQVVRRGGRVCLIEAGRFGGTCLNVGCIPTKAMLHASGLCGEIRQAGQFGIDAGRPRVDGLAFMKRVADVVAALRDRAEKGAASSKQIDVVRGRGRLVDPTTLTVATADGEQTVRARSIILATGSRPARPNFLPWDSGRIWTSDEATTAENLPQSVLVMGGGVIGCELATVYSELGIPTHLVEMVDTLLPELDDEAAKLITQMLTDRGVEVRTGRKVAAVTTEGNGIAAKLDDGQTIHAQCILTAVGRAPEIDKIGLEEIGVELAHGVIRVDERCRTSVENVYAVGDVAETRQYAHLAARMGLVAAENAMGHEMADDRTVVPVGVYTHPEIASVGLTREKAKEQFGAVRVFRTSYANSSMAVACGQAEGQVKVLADPESGRIYGALWIGPHATDMIQELAVAMRHGLTLGQLHDTIHPHPTFQEAVADVADAWTAQAQRKRR